MQPFVRGGAEILADDLYKQLLKRGHDVVLFRLPFPKDFQISMFETVFMAENLNFDDYDVLIAFKFPAYCAVHRHKNLWLFHQFRQVYELFGQEYGLQENNVNKAIKDIITSIDINVIYEAKNVFTNSEEVSKRLMRYNGLSSTVLNPPLLNYENYYCGETGDYIYYPSRINGMKRQHIAVEAMKYVKSGVKLFIDGKCAEIEHYYYEKLCEIVEKNNLQDKIVITNKWASNEDKMQRLSDSLAVIYTPYKEDSCGFVTMEAFYSSKPVITCVDSGGVVEFVTDGETGVFSQPDPKEIAMNMDMLFNNKHKTEEMGKTAYNDIIKKNITWDKTIQKLLSTVRFAWFTPFSNKSAIGAVSKQVCEKMANDCHVNIDIWTNDKNDLIKTDLTIRSFDAVTINMQELERYDYVVYNMGNYALFHKDIYEVLRRFPGIVVLHDQTMNNFWWSIFVGREMGEPAGYEIERDMLFDMLENYKRDNFDIFLRGYDFIGMSNETSLKPFLKNAAAVFSHASFFVERLKAYTDVPVVFSYLPCDNIRHSFIELESDIKKIIERARKEGRKIVVSTGIVHPVKHIDKVVDVLLDNKVLSDKLCYIVIGSYGGDYGERLEDHSKKRLKNCLYMTGYQPYESMFAALREADLCINLRHPNSEICSLSLLEQMTFGKPVLVLNSGFFGEVPENCVVRISLENEKENIARKLEQLVEVGDFGKTGENAGAFVDANCSLQQYSDKFIMLTEYFNKANVPGLYYYTPPPPMR
ncbi:MAG: glycosyltransferase [Treponema sp.]|nr:glycosyltransferase [Treponema sp.]